MKQDLILNLIDVLRGEPLNPSDGAVLAGVLVAWQSLSQRDLLPSQMKLTEGLQKDPRAAEQVLREIADHNALPAFLEASTTLRKISPRVAGDIIKMVMIQFQQGLWGDYDPSDLVTVASATWGAEGSLPPEVCDLLFALAVDGEADRSVYLPWESSGQLLGRFLNRGFNTSAELRGEQQAYIADIVGAVIDTKAHATIQRSDPISSPVFSEKGVLTKFDIVVATPPFGGKSTYDNQLTDPFKRFPEKSNSLTVLAVRHVMAQAKGRALVLVSNSILFAAGGEKRLRRELLEAGMLEAVVSLPAGLLYNAAIPFSILVLNCAGGCDTVRLINCDNDKYKKSESRTRFTLDNIPQIVELAKYGFDCEDMWSGTREEIYRNDLNLLPSRYVHDPQMLRVTEALGPRDMQRLDDVAVILRPIQGRNEGDQVVVFEVGAADVFNTGFLAAPKKQVKVPTLLGRDADQFLKAMDIVVVIKGSVGKVSIAPLETPPAGPGGWVVGQSFAIVRVDDPFYAQLLVVFLRSGVGQGLIRRLVAGAAIPFLQIKELRQLEVPAPSADKLRRAQELLTRQQLLRDQIQVLQTELAAINFAEWELP